MVELAKAMKLIEAALALISSLHVLEGFDKDGVERLLEQAVETLRRVRERSA